MPGNPAGWQARFVVDLLRSLRPQMRSTYLRWAIGQHVAQQDPDFLVAQFRIEADWKKHCEDNLSRHCPDSEENYLTAEAILGKIRRVHDKAKLLYVVCDETGLPMPPAEMKALAKDKFDLQLTFKSDYLSVFEQAMLSRLHLWLLDFEFATFSRNFIGNSRSTFSCLATLERYCREGADVKDHTIYNAPGPSVRRRTDNGCYWSAEEATRPNYLR
jgi:hypothetical protein